VEQMLLAPFLQPTRVRVETNTSVNQLAMICQQPLHAVINFPASLFARGQRQNQISVRLEILTAQSQQGRAKRRCAVFIVRSPATFVGATSVHPRITDLRNPRRMLPPENNAFAWSQHGNKFLPPSQASRQNSVIECLGQVGSFGLKAAEDSRTPKPCGSRNRT